MLIDLKAMYSMTEANLNFSLITRSVDKDGKAVISRNSKPKYLVIPIDKMSDEDINTLDELLNRINNTDRNQQYEDVIESKHLKAPAGFIIEKSWTRRRSQNDDYSRIVEGSTVYTVYTDDDTHRFLGSYLSREEAHRTIKKHCNLQRRENPRL